MGDKTEISWCDHTYNIWIGCAKVSEGCKLCYAEREFDRNRWGELWGPKAQRHRTTTQQMLTSWNGHYWHECGACGWRGEQQLFPECPYCRQPALRPTRQRVFINSLSDIFEDRAELVPWRNEFWALVQICSNLDFLLLTKRPENVCRLSPPAWREQAWPANIWLGASVENQRRASERIPDLIKLPARVHWLSVEPMLEPLNLWKWLLGTTPPRPVLDWVVVGGESGPGCRPMHTDWARRLLEQCQAAGVPFYMKQLGGAYDRRERLEDFPKDLRIREWPGPSSAASIFQVPST